MRSDPPNKLTAEMQSPSSWRREDTLIVTSRFFSNLLGMLLANYFADKYGARCNRKLKGFSTETRNFLTAYGWPGNVRELENAIERSVVLGTTDLILPEDLPEAVLEAELSPTLMLRYHEAVTQAKKQIILAATRK